MRVAQHELEGRRLTPLLEREGRVERVVHRLSRAEQIPALGAHLTKPEEHVRIVGDAEG